MRPLYILCIFLLLGTSTIAQNINNYKYVIVPDQYSFLQSPDQYQLNSLTTFLFNKYGFSAFKLSDPLPNDINITGCNTLYADVTRASSMIREKLKVTLKDCNGKVIFVSSEGVSKEKVYEKAFQEALREAFFSIEALGYAYAAPAAPVDITNGEMSNTTLVNRGSTLSTTATAEVLLENEPTPKAEEANKKAEYISQNSGYRVLYDGETYYIYDGDRQIGRAKQLQEGVFFVQTDDFDGAATLNGDTFIITRRVKGVAGEVEMIFTKTN